MSGVQVLHPLPDHQRAAAAALYWQAFGPKLGRLMGPAAMAEAYLARIIRPDHVLAAVNDSGQLLGVAGFKTPYGAFADGSWTDLCAVYGLAGATWRRAAFEVLNREVDNDRFLIDGISVAAVARGQGIGTALIEALCAQGRARGYRAIRLDVVQENLRARALYSRLGFVTERTDHLGVARYLLGFNTSVVMVRAL